METEQQIQNEQKRIIEEKQIERCFSFPIKKRYIKIIVCINVYDYGNTYNQSRDHQQNQVLVTSYFDSGLHYSARSIFSLEKGWEIQSIKKAIPAQVKKMFLEKYKENYGYEMMVVESSLYKSGHNRVILKVSPVCYPIPSSVVLEHLSDFISTQKINMGRNFDEDWVVSVKNYLDWNDGSENEGWSCFHSGRVHQCDDIIKKVHPGKWRIEVENMYSGDKRLPPS